MRFLRIHSTNFFFPPYVILAIPQKKKRKKIIEFDWWHPSFIFAHVKKIEKKAKTSLNCSYKHSINGFATILVPKVATNFPLIVYLGHAPHLEILALVVLISYWLLRLLQIVLAQAIRLVKVVFGKGYGRCRCPTKSNILFGGCVTMLFPQNAIWSEDI